MAAYGRDYGNEYGYGNQQLGRDRGQWGSQGGRPSGRYEGTDRGPGPVARRDSADFGNRYGARYGGDYPRDRYDRGYKSQWQTDYGDPYGDRIRQTPMRVVREDSSRYSGSPRYGRDFGRNPYPPQGRSFESRGYDSGPFGVSRRPLPYEQTGWSWPH